MCTYCGGGSDTPPREVQYDLPVLQSFLSTDPDPVLEFYGGEPLLRAGTIEKIIDSIRGASRSRPTESCSTGWTRASRRSTQSSSP